VMPVWNNWCDHHNLMQITLKIYQEEVDGVGVVKI
jgi:hypothetical protein